jgi:bacterioferritin-associated ferredoxin
MTAVDEITTKTPDALYNGTAVVELIKSCVPNIKDPWSVSAIDLDTILVAIRSAAGGNDLEIESGCPKCGNESKFGVNLPGILATMKSADYDHELEINDLKIKFKPIVFREMNEAGLAQLDIQRSFARLETVETDEEKAAISNAALTKITELTMKIVTKGIEYIKTPTTTVTNREYILDYLKNCDKNVYITIRDHSTNMKQESEIKPIKLSCTECGNEYEQTITLNPSDFFV